MEHIVQKILKKLNKDYNYIVKKKRGSSPEIKLGDFLLATIKWSRAKDTCSELSIGYQTFNRLVNREFPDINLAGGGETWSHYFLSLAEYKRCFKCAEIKKYSEYYNSDNIRHCIECHKIKNKKYNSTNNIVRAEYKDSFLSIKERNPNVRPKATNKDAYTKDTIIESICRFYATNQRIPTTKDFAKDSDYPSYKTVQNHFKYWNAAIEAAGFEPNIQSGFGTNTYGLDGILYRSQAEAYFADNFLFNKHEYAVEPKYPDSNWLYDWYVKDLDLYIELDGGLRPERIKEKIELNKRLRRKLLVIPISTLVKLAPLSQQAEEEDLKSFQCRFESDRGYQ